MTEINMTALVNDPYYSAFDCSGSRAEHGDNAGRMTWEVSSSQLDENDEPYQTIIRHTDELRCHFREYGAWDEKEISEWSNDELVALVVQEFSAGYRELTEDDLDEDQTSGRVYQGDTDDWYYYVGI